MEGFLEVSLVSTVPASPVTYRILGTSRALFPLPIISRA